MVPGMGTVAEVQRDWLAGFIQCALVVNKERLSASDVDVRIEYFYMFRPVAGCLL